MRIDLESKPSFAMAVVTLDQGETIVAEAGSMVGMSAGLTVDTKFSGTGSGFLDWVQAVVVGLLRRFLAGESMFVNHYTADRAGAHVMLAPSMTGDIVHLDVGNGPITVQGTSFLAAAPTVTMDLVWGGWSMLFSGEGAFFLRCDGSGELLVNSYGAIDKIEIDGSYVIDSGHVVAFAGDLKYTIRRAGGWKTTLLSGEGLVLEFQGKGTVWTQSRNLGAMVSWIRRLLPG